MSSKNEALRKKKGAKCSGSCPSCCVKINDEYERSTPKKEKKFIEAEEKEVRRDTKE